MKKSTIFKLTAALTAAVTGGTAYAVWKKAVVKTDKPFQYEDQVPEEGTQWASTLTEIQERIKWLRRQKSEEVSITSFDGKKLRGLFLPAETESDKVILAVHGYGGCAENDMAYMCYTFHKRGYHVLMMDNRAHGGSEGKYIGYGCLERDDCCRFSRYIHDRFQGKCSIYLYGISMGASSILMASSMNLPPTVKGVVADCGFTSAWEEIAHVIKSKYRIPVFPILYLANLINQVVAGYGFKECNAAAEVAKTKIPVFIIHGEKDDFVPVSMAKEIYDSCASRKQFWTVKGAKHAESYFTAKEEYEERVFDFLNSLT